MEDYPYTPGCFDCLGYLGLYPACSGQPEPPRPEPVAAPRPATGQQQRIRQAADKWQDAAAEKAAVTSPTPMATPKQILYIKILVQRYGNSGLSLPADLASLSRREASEVIEYLKPT